MAGIIVDAYKTSGIDPFPEQTGSREIRRELGDEGQPGCQWFLDGPDSWVWVIDSSEAVKDIPAEEWQPPFEPHALLSDGVRLSVQMLGTMVFYVDDRDAAIAFSHAGPEAGAGVYELSEEIRIANEILKLMNWI